MSSNNPFTYILFVQTNNDHFLKCARIEISMDHIIHDVNGKTKQDLFAGISFPHTSNYQKLTSMSLNCIFSMRLRKQKKILQ